MGGRRGSIGSTGSTESNSTEGSDSLTSSQASISQPSNKNGNNTEQVLRGRGYIARILDGNCGLIWWVLQPNHLQSVWFINNQFPNKDLRSVFKTGDPVKFIAARSTAGPTSWLAKQVFSDNNAAAQPHGFPQPSQLML